MGSEMCIRDRALQHEPSKNVQHQAVFALSQLPEQRAIKALIEVAENQSMSRDNRKQAIFWMAQNESTLALDYLDRVLESLP